MSSRVSIIRISHFSVIIYILFPYIYFRIRTLKNIGILLTLGESLEIEIEIVPNINRLSINLISSDRITIIIHSMLTCELQALVWSKCNMMIVEEAKSLRKKLKISLTFYNNRSKQTGLICYEIYVVLK